jgi:hypothetical protein
MYGGSHRSSKSADSEDPLEGLDRKSEQAENLGPVRK